jgi:hypothetical protein
VRKHVPDAAHRISGALLSRTHDNQSAFEWIPALRSGVKAPHRVRDTVCLPRFGHTHNAGSGLHHPAIPGTMTKPYKDQVSPRLEQR